MSMTSWPTLGCDESKARATRKTLCRCLRQRDASSPSICCTSEGAPSLAIRCSSFAIARAVEAGVSAGWRITACGKIIKALGRREGVTQLHPHAFRHSSAVELLRRSRNLRAVQAHLRHSDIQTTTVYTEMTQGELQKVVNLFDDDGK